MFAMGARGVRRERRRHCGAPMLRKYATTSLLLLSMARLRGVSPSLQRSELVLRRRRRAQLRGAASLLPRRHVCPPLHEQLAHGDMTAEARGVKRGCIPAHKGLQK